jgi:small conductance mechanosensitive channel
MDMEYIIAKAQELISVFGIRIIAAIAILVIGRWVAKFLRNLAGKIMTKANVDPTLISFLKHVIYIALMVFIILAALGQLGIQTTSFIAVIGAAGLAIGLALQGSLANFAAGVLMIIFRPFKVGDLIEAAGVLGTVEEIQIFTTQIATPDNKTVIIPNSKLTSDNITNFTAKDSRRVDLVAGVSYEENIDKVRSAIADVLSQDDRILKDPPPTVAVLEMADSSVNFAVRPWVKPSDYWGVYFDVNEKIKKRFDSEGITIPFPQRDVHVYEHNNAGTLSGEKV